MNEKREWSGKKLIPFDSFFCAAVCQFNEFTVDLCASDWMRDAFFYFVFFVGNLIRSAIMVWGLMNIDNV